MNSKRKMQSGRTTAVIWSLTLLVYLGAIVAAWQLDFIRYSRYSLEEALKQIARWHFKDFGIFSAERCLLKRSFPGRAWEG